MNKNSGLSELSQEQPRVALLLFISVYLHRRAGPSFRRRRHRHDPRGKSSDFQSGAEPSGWLAGGRSSPEEEEIIKQIAP